jgi:hypothetical protein
MVKGLSFSSDPMERLLQLVSPEPNSGCWLWLGDVKWNGYARITINGRRTVAHRVSYELHGGVIPEGLELDHTCRVRCCVNPRHLEPVTHAENLRRGIGAELTRLRKAAITHCKAGHPLVSVDCRGSRYCNICRNKAKRDARRNGKA